MAQAFGKKLLSAPVWAKLIPLCYFGYTGAVFQNQTLHDKKCVGVYNYPHFSPGSADELLRDHLNTGDIVLFNRRWYVDQDWCIFRIFRYMAISLLYWYLSQC